MPAISMFTASSSVCIFMTMRGTNCLTFTLNTKGRMRPSQFWMVRFWQETFLSPKPDWSRHGSRFIESRCWRIGSLPSMVKSPLLSNRCARSGDGIRYARFTTRRLFSGTLV